TNASAGFQLGHGRVADTATIAGGVSPTGTITFDLYGPDNSTCTGAPAFTTTKTVSGNGSHTSAAFLPTTAGSYRWIASYGGDANNAAASGGACGDSNESVIVSAAGLLFTCGDTGQLSGSTCTYGQPGSTYFVVPPGVHSITVEAI